MEINKFLSNKNLKQRAISAAILLPIALFIILTNNILLEITVILIAVIMSFEWNNIISSAKQEDYKKWLLGGVAYITIFIASLFYLKGLENSSSILLTIFFLVVATDIGAYFAGTIIGGAKILPKISPKKTWAGLGGGVAAAAVVVFFIQFFLAETGVFAGIFLSILVALISQAGDFFESWVKRQFDVKDSSSLIPGHGGIMDRLDGFAFACPFIAILNIFSGGTIFS